MSRCAFLLTILVLIPGHVLGLICSRYPANTFAAKSPVDENYAISISGNPQTYVLGQGYNVSLTAYNGLRFVSFMLALENDNGVTSYNEDLGHFEVTDSTETRYNPNCINILENTNMNPKTKVDLVWVAPEQPGSGCILIRATLLQHRDVWYMDDGGLTKRICEEVVDDAESNNPGTEQRECCACDEARYEIIFEGLWSRNLHPKDFPTKGWITRFSDILGVAHSNDYRFWQYGEHASENMKEFAQHGSVQLLEREFKYYFQEKKIRTIIKARGPMFPNLNSPSMASLRVDPQHHLLSLASKIQPSPDWIVGVSGLELCMPNCTWLEHKVVNLYPWDIGTDAGPTYTSAAQPQVPPDVIRRMRSDFPNDPRSPFYDDSGAPMKPLATLTIKFKRAYERLCEDENSNNIATPRECVTHPWTAWSECSAKCGEGRQFRTRVYKQPKVASIYDCDVIMVNRQERVCSNHCDNVDTWESNAFEYQDSGAYTQRPMSPECEISAWSQWSECSKACGEGTMTRRRQYVNPLAETKCQSKKFIRLRQRKTCVGRNCLGEIPSNSRDYAGPQMRGDSNRDEIGTLDSAIEEDGQRAEDRRELDREPQFEQSNYGTNYDPQYSSKENSHEGLDNRYSKADAFQAPSGDLGSTFPTHNDRERFEIDVPSNCLKRLQFYACSNKTTIGNFWFYNYCEDACMLYASGPCDRNENKFDSLEKCEQRCRSPQARQYVRRMAPQDCS